MSTDTLSEVLRAVRLSGAVFFRVDACAPWVAEAPDGKDVAPHILPGLEHVIEYHLVTKGKCFANLVGEPAVELTEGDLVLFPQGDRHVVSSAPGMRGGEPALEEHRRPENGQLPIAMHMGGTTGDRTEVVCGFLGCDAAPFNPLLSTLPRMIHMKGGSGRDGHLTQLMRLAVMESDTRGAGSECMLARVSELLFIEAVRRYIAGLPHETRGWLAGLRDDVVGRALGCLHNRPTQEWTLEELAKEVGLSRSMLAERFHHYVGMPPMQYLTRWRMQLAATLLKSTTATLAQIAEQVGYGSEAAFSRAFKRSVGLSPSSFREGERAPTTPPQLTEPDILD